MRRSEEGEQYLSQFPKLRRWINQCVCCGRMGYKPDMPIHISHSRPNVAANTLRQLFTPLAVDEDGRCELCSAIGERAHDDETPG